MRERKRKNAALRREKYKDTEEFKAAKRASDRAYIERMKIERPEVFAAMRERQAEWRRKKRAAHE
jgi:hypothetical protein